MITFLALFLFCDCSHACSSTLFFIKGMFFEQLKTSVEKCFSWHSLKWGPRTWDPEPEIRDPGPQTEDPGTENQDLGLKTLKPGSPRLWTFLLIFKIKRWKVRNDLKCQKDMIMQSIHLHIFSHKDFWIFFLELRFVS